MLSSLDSKMTSAYSRAAMPTGLSKGRTPYDFSSGSSGVFDVDPNYGKGDQQDQYEHNRGDFRSASRIIIHRFASQPVFAARLGVKNKERSVSKMMQTGYLPAGGVPSWLGMPDGLEMLSVHPILEALANPNPHQTQFNMFEIAIGSILVTGRCFFVALFSESKERAFDIYAIPSTWMSPIDGQTKWVIKPPGEAGNGITVGDDQVAHAYFADPSSLTGALSPMAMVARAILSGEAISAAQYNEFKNGSMPKVALIAGDVMNETSFTDDPNRTSSARPVRLEPFQRRQIVTWFQQQYAGVAKHGLPIVLDQIIRDIKILSRKPNEMGYMESAGMTKEQVFEQLGISSILTGQLSGQTRASGDLADQIAVKNCLNPIINLVSQCLTKKFGPLFAVGKERLVIWIATALFMDSEYDIELLTLGARTYSLRRNEWRDIMRQRFGGLPYLPEFDDVVMPQTLDERDADDNRMGIGRIAVNKPTPAPVVVPPAAAKPAAKPADDDDEKKNGHPRLLLNGRH